MSRLQLFGSPHIESSVAPVPQFRSRKVEALLYYLAVMPGQHRRIHLANLLWSELPEDTALGNLRYALWNLRQAVKNIPLSAERLTITFQADEAILVDVNEFKTLIERSDLRRNSTSARSKLATDVITPEQVACLQRATDLYHGDFLAGFDLVGAVSFEEWLQFQRTTLHNLAMDAFNHLGNHYAAAGQWSAAITITQRLLALEPWQERAHRQLMVYLATVGQRDAALAQYQQCCKSLDVELGVEPDPATQALMEQIRSGQLTTHTQAIVNIHPPLIDTGIVDAGIVDVVLADVETVTTLVPLTKSALPKAEIDKSWPDQPSVVTLPLVGRSQEFNWLRQQWQHAMAGQSGLVLIRGEAGIGKTRLVEELCRYVSVDGGLALRARCYEFSEPLPYQPIAAALQPQITRLRAEKDRLGDTLDEAWFVELAQLMPELRHATGLFSSLSANKQDSKHSGDRYRLFEAVTHVLQKMATQQPILFFLDDLQWADADTLDLVGYLVRRLTSASFLLIGAYRPGEALNDHALVALQRPLYNEGLDQELNLAPLRRAAVQQIIQMSVPTAGCVTHSEEGFSELGPSELGPSEIGSDTFVQQLYEISQGNPFILCEILREMKENGWLEFEAMAGELNERANDTTLPHQEPLQLLSAHSTPFPLVKESGTDQSSRVPILNRNGPTVLEVTPTLQLPSALSEQLHLLEVKNRIRRRVARLLPDHQHLLSIAAVVGRPFEAKLLQVASGLAPTVIVNTLEDWLKRDLVHEVSEQEQPAGKVNGASKFGKVCYDFKHNLLRSVLYHDLSRVRLQALHLQVGNALEQLYAGKLDRITEWLANHFERADEAPKALCYFQQAGRQAQEVYALPLALKHYQQALACWEQLYDPNDQNVPTVAWRQRWDLLLSLSEISRMLGHWQKQTPGLEIVVQEVTHWGDDHDRLRVIEQQLARLQHSPDLDKRRQLARDGLQLARQLEDGLAEGNFLQACGECNRDMANHSEALANYNAARIIFEQIGQLRQIAFSLIGMGKIHMFDNQFGQALLHFEQAASYAQKEGYQDARIEALTSIARMYLFIGNLEGALSISQNALLLCDTIGFDSGAVSALVAQGYGNILTGNLVLARTHFERAWTISREMDQSLRMADVQCCFGHLCLLEQNYAQALQHFKQAEEYCGSFYHGRAIEARSFRAIAHLAMGEWKEALVCSHHAVVWMIGREHSLIAPQRIYLNQYQVLLAQGECEEAQEALVKAHRLVVNQLDSLTGAYISAIGDNWIRDAFLTRLPWNQEITTVWEMLPLSNSHVALHFLHGYPG